MTESHRFTFASHNVEQTMRAGFHLGALLQAGDVICLSGNLGAGKTVFTRGVAEGWQALEAVTSPTFVLIHEHRRAQDGQVLYHVDCYRLHGAGDAAGVGLDDLLYSDGSLVIEWPEHIQDVLPDHRLWISFTMDGDTRREITVEAAGSRSIALLEAFRRSVPAEQQIIG